MVTERKNKKESKQKKQVEIEHLKKVENKRDRKLERKKILFRNDNDENDVHFSDFIYLSIFFIKKFD